MLPLLPFVAGLATGVAAIQLWRSKKAQTKLLAIKASVIDAAKETAPAPKSESPEEVNVAAQTLAVATPDEVSAIPPARQRVQKRRATKTVKRSPVPAHASEVDA